MAEKDPDLCIACAIPIKWGDRVLPDIDGGLLHYACCGPEREAYVGADGEPLKEGEPIPTGYIYAPMDADEFTQRFFDNNKVEGTGIGNVHLTLPCPFCAAPGFAKYELLEMRKVMSEPHTCTECERSSKAIFVDNAVGGVALHLVQTGGPDAPKYVGIKREGT